jgi:putative transposase
MLNRSQKITYTILEGAEILSQGHETARRLWNYTRWCLIGYNEKLRIERGDSWERFKRNQAYNRTGEKYPGFFTLQKELRDYWAGRDLSARCFTYTVKNFDTAMRSWFSNLKSNPKARPPKYCKEPRVLSFEVGCKHNARPVGEWTYQLTILGGHIQERHALIKLHIQPGIKMRDIRLIHLQPDGTGVIVYRVEEAQKPGEGIAAIDLGIINIATIAFQTGESVMVSGKALLSANQWGHKQASKCKPKNWQKGKKQEGQSKGFKAYRRKAGNISKLAVHNLTRFIINECVARKVSTLVLGDLKGIRDNADHGKAGNQKLHNWPFAEITRQLKYKGEEASIEVIQRSERGTSSHHHLTGEKGVREPRGLVKFKKAGQIINSDVNGAFGILNNYLTEVGQEKVSPVPVSGVGVEAALPGPPSLSEVATGTGKVQGPLQIDPTFVAKFNLQNWSLIQTRCNRGIYTR